MALSTGRRSFSSPIHFTPYKIANGADVPLWTVGGSENPVVIDQVLIGTNDPLGSIAFTLDSFSANGLIWGTQWEDLSVQHFGFVGPVYILPGHSLRARLVGTGLTTTIYLAMRNLWEEG